MRKAYTLQYLEMCIIANNTTCPCRKSAINKLVVILITFDKMQFIVWSYKLNILLA